MEVKQWYNHTRFREVIASGYKAGVTIEILSIEEFSPSQIDTTGNECVEDHSWIETAYEVKSRNTVVATGYTYEDTNIVVFPKPHLCLLKNGRRIE